MMKTSRESAGFGVRYTRADGFITMNCLSLGYLAVFDTEEEAKKYAKERIREFGRLSTYSRGGWSTLKSYELVRVQKGQRQLCADEIRIHQLQIALFQSQEREERMRQERDHYRQAYLHAIGDAERQAT